METTNETQSIEVLFYSYVSNTGVKLFTPSAHLAHARAYYFGTDDVYVHLPENL